MTAQVHICGPGEDARYVARVRLFGRRRYSRIGRFRSRYRAAMALMKKFEGNPNYKRGDVLLSREWYDPIPILEVKRP